MDDEAARLQQQLLVDTMCAEIAMTVKPEAENGRSSKHHAQDAEKKARTAAADAAAAAETAAAHAAAARDQGAASLLQQGGVGEGGGEVVRGELDGAEDGEEGKVEIVQTLGVVAESPLVLVELEAPGGGATVEEEIRRDVRGDGCVQTGHEAVEEALLCGHLAEGCLALLEVAGGRGRVERVMGVQLAPDARCPRLRAVPGVLLRVVH